MNQQVVKGLILWVLALLLAGSVVVAKPVKLLLSTAEGVPDVLEEFAAGWNAAHPDIQLEVEVKPVGWYNWEQNIITRLAGGVAPDLVMLGVDIVPTFREGGLLVDLNPFITGDRFPLRDFAPSTLTFMEHNAAIYGLPNGVFTMVEFVNVDAFGEAGVPLPDRSWTATWDWAQYATAARRLTVIDASNNVKRYGTSFAPNAMRWLHYAWQRGGDFWGTGTNGEPTCVLDSPAVTQTIKDWAALLESRAAQISGWALKPFNEGTQAIWPQGTWVTKEQIPDINASFMPAPLYDRDPATFQWVLVSGIMKASPHKDEAWQVLKTLTTRGSEIALVHGKMGLPAYRPVLSAGMNALLPGWDAPSKQVAIESLNWARHTPLTFGWADMMRVVEQTTREIAQGKKAAEYGLSEAVKAVNLLLAEKSRR